MFIECNPSVTGEIELERVRARAAKDSRFHHRYLDTCHDAMVSDPDGVTTLLLEAAAQ